MSTQRQDCNKPSKKPTFNKPHENQRGSNWNQRSLNWISRTYRGSTLFLVWFLFSFGFFKDVEIWWKLDVSFYTSFKISEEPFEAKRAYDLRYIRGGSREEKGSPLPFTEFLVRLTCSVVLSARLLLWSGRPLMESWQHKMPKQCKTHCE